MHRLVIALTSLIGLIAAAYLGYALLFAGGSDRAASLVPANAAIYANVYLQPSAGQQANLSGLIGRLPGFADEATLDEKVDQIVQNLVAGLGIDYRTDIEPWVGDQVAAAAWFGDEATPVQRAVAIVDVKDAAAMESSLASLADRQGESFPEETHGGVTLHVGSARSYAVVAEMLVVSDSPDGLRAVIDTQSGGANLASRADFRDAMGRVPSDHLASAFVDVAMLAAGVGASDATGGFTTLAAALVADRDALRVTGSALLPHAAEASATVGLAPGSSLDPLAEWMPGDTVAEVVIVGLRGMLADAEEAAFRTPQGQQLSDAMTTIRTLAAFGLGIDLDADVLPLLDGETALALTAIEDGAPRGQLVLRPRDFDAATAALDRVAEALADAGDRRVEPTDTGDVTVVTVPQLGEVAFATVDEVVILGLTVEDVAAAAAARADRTTLAASEAYAAAFEGAGGRGLNEAYADVGALLEALGIASTLPVDARAILSELGTFSATARSADDQIEFTAVLTIDGDGTD
ncbi:MAG: DUF3352 domain-containing protein [Chloroflexi bacterium]|nr:DUF3352 domain-containing protein [Chloroflexota bacterium]